MMQFKSITDRDGTTGRMEHREPTSGYYLSLIINNINTVLIINVFK